MKETLEKIRAYKDQYDTCKLSLAEDQKEILRGLSSAYYDLNEYRIEARESWMIKYSEAKGSNAYREKFADTEVPELYLIRRTMEATKILIDSVRSTLSKAQ